MQHFRSLCEVRCRATRYIDELTHRLGVFTDQAAARATVRVCCLLINQYSRLSPGMDTALVDPSKLDMLLAQLDSEVNCPSHCSTANGDILPRGVTVPVQCTHVRSLSAVVAVCSLSHCH